MREEHRRATRATGRSEEAGPVRRGRGRNARLAAVVGAGLVAVLLAGCGTEDADASAPKKVRGEAVPAPGDSPGNGPSGKESSAPSASPSRDGGAKGGEEKAPGGGPGNDGSGSSGEQGAPSQGAPASGPCKTSGLALSSSEGMGEGTLVVHMRNTTSATCTLKGHPGVDLNGADGSFSADRSGLSAPTVSIKPGEETRFNLHYPQNDTGGSGVDITNLVVTPPDETQSQSLPVNINLPVSDGTGGAVTTDPVGAGT